MRALPVAFAASLVVVIAAMSPVQSRFNGALPSELMQSRGKALCFGNHARARRPDEVRARQLLKGVLPIPNHPAYRLPFTLEANPDPFDSANWQVQFHSLAWLDVLRREFLRTGNTEYREAYVDLLHRYVNSNPGPEGYTDHDDPHSYRWYDAVVGWRAQVLACAIGWLGPDEVLTHYLQLHGENLIEERNYVKHGNHALHQNNGLLTAGCVLGNRRWINLAVARDRQLMESAITPDGVSREASTIYHIKNFEWWSEASRRIELCAPKQAFGMTRVERMADAAVHMLAPDQTLAMLGDTIRRPYNRLEGSEHLLYASTGGRDGVVPVETRVVYPDPGYIFSRSGWGQDRAFAKENYLTIRFGSGPRHVIHGQQDGASITFYAQGRWIIHDQGVYAYSGGRFRRYVRGAAAHNVVVVDGAKAWPAQPTKLAAEDQLSGVDYFLLRPMYYGRNIDWRREVVFERRSGILLVRDTLQANHPRTFRQRWHLMEGASVQRQDGVLRIDDRMDTVVHNLSGIDSFRVVSGQHDPILGWRSYDYGKVIAVPVLDLVKTGAKVEFSTLFAPGTAADTRVGYSVGVRGFALRLTDGCGKRLIRVRDGRLTADNRAWRQCVDSGTHD